MSFVVTTYLPEGIILGADSRQTATVEGKTPDGKQLPRFETVTSDNCYKVFHLEEQNIGVSVVVEKMMRYFSARYPNADTAFHMVGYRTEGKVSVPYVYHCQVSRNEIKRVNVKPGTDEIS